MLDVGCRFGALTRAYVEGNQIVGIDVDREALAEAAKLGIEPVWADAAEPFPLDDESFDVVVLGELLEHLPMPERTIAEARRVLKPGGRLGRLGAERLSPEVAARFPGRATARVRPHAPAPVLAVGAYGSCSPTSTRCSCASSPAG